MPFIFINSIPNKAIHRITTNELMRDFFCMGSNLVWLIVCSTVYISLDVYYLNFFLYINKWTF